MIFSCDNSTEPQVIHGCMDSQSCNYNPNSTHDNNSCLYLDECGECGGDNTTCLDECGVINGNTIQECGSCDYVYLWDECYNIEQTTDIFIGSFFCYNGCISGEIPPEIGKLTNLLTLRLDDNDPSLDFTTV